MCETSPDIICSKRLKIHHEFGTYEVVGTTTQSGRRSVSKSGTPPKRGVRNVGLYLIIQVSSEVSVLWDSSLQFILIAMENKTVVK